MTPGRSLILLLVFCLMTTGDAFLKRLFHRVQKNWMTKWDRLRYHQTRPRMIAQMQLNGSPTFVQAVESTIGDIELAVSLVNKSAHEVSLLRVQKVQGWLQHQGHTTAGTIARDLGWPNAVGRVDGDTLIDSQNTYWWMTSTYYEPQRSEGNIVLLPVNTNGTGLNPHLGSLVITPSGGSRNWYYSMIEWVDMNQDGWLDIVTSRSRGNPGDIKFSELIWLENPGYMSLWRSGRNWRPHRITHGPDVSFRVLRIPLPSGESRLVIIGAGYWDNKLYAVWSEDPEENWSNVDAINERVIDNHGWFYDLQIADVNADGRDDIIVSTWVHGLQQGSVNIYEIPCDFIRDKWRRHTLIDGAVDMPLPDLGSGGKINIFHPVLSHGTLSRKKKPFILVSGDNEGRVYVLVPDSRKTNNWAYISHTIYQARGPVGALTVDDLNHDGFMEIVIPVMDSNKLVFFSYEPGPIGPEYFVDERANP